MTLSCWLLLGLGMLCAAAPGTQLERNVQFPSPIYLISHILTISHRREFFIKFIPRPVEPTAHPPLKGKEKKKVGMKFSEGRYLIFPRRKIRNHLPRTEMKILKIHLKRREEDMARPH